MAQKYFFETPVAVSAKDSYFWEEVIAKSLDEELRINLFLDSQWILFTTLYLDDITFVFSDGKNASCITIEELRKEKPVFWGCIILEDRQRLEWFLSEKGVP